MWVLRNSGIYHKSGADYVAKSKREAKRLAAALNTAGGRVWVERVTA